MTASLRTPGPDTPRQCFVIGPIGNPYAAHGSPERDAYEHHLTIFEQVIAPACEKFDVTALRADDIADAGDINEQICRHVIGSDLVIADVSGGNPNVMYELGLRHLNGGPTIHIGEDGQLPFDIASVRTIKYQRSRSMLATARRRIESALEAGFRDGFELLTPARVLREIQPDTRRPPDPAAAEETQEDRPGLLDDIAAVEDGLGELTAQLVSIVQTVETIGSLTEKHHTEALDLARAGAPANAQLAVMMRFAHALGRPAGEIRSTTRDFVERMNRSDSGVRTALALVQDIPAEKRDDRTALFLNQLVTLKTSAATGLAELTRFGTAAGNMTRMSRYLRKPLQDMSGAAKELESAITCIGAWADRARSLLPSDEE
ncbi:hypothetical protein ACIQBJ_02740 [Kitasatospora sp. NPDC088391]|uniref:hypothetical protein n=1 Tax=Kitasatospora sp. NPDC088391 TaxID=3364074 RepID=UPI00382B8F61